MLAERKFPNASAKELSGKDGQEAERSFRLGRPQSEDADRLESTRRPFFSVESSQSAPRRALAWAMLRALRKLAALPALSTTAFPNVRNRWVNFRISDVYIPDPAQILMELHGKDLLQGKVIDVSDSGTQQEAFAVVEVEGLKQPVVVPMNRIRGSVCE